MAVDYVYRIEQPHMTGSLARVCSAIAEAEGLIGDVVTVRVGRQRSIREISVEVAGQDEAEAVANRLNEIDGVQVISCHDRALLAHEGGKLETAVRNPITSLQEARDVYTPGVARVCTAIADDSALANRFTMIGRTVAIITNGTRVLGLGDIGPVASMPVMEGKALFYRQMAGISAVPILIDTKDVDEFVETVLRIAPGFGAIHLEDIRVPDCFEIERRLIEAVDIPVMHDDVHGTGTVALAAALAACDHVGIEFGDSTVGQIGLGAAGLGIASLMVDGGAKRVIAFDPDERSHERAAQHGIEIASFEEVLADSRILIATTGKPGLIEPSMVQEGQIIFAMSNPDPEIEPTAAIEAGAAFAVDGAAVNNVLGYPGIFRGALLAGARDISTEMKLAAAHAIARVTKTSDLVPDALDPEVHGAVAAAVMQAACDEHLDRPDHVPLGL